MYRSFLRISELEKPLFTTMSFHKGVESTQLPAHTGRQCLVKAQCFIYH